MTVAIERTLSMRSEVGQMLAYRRWEAEAPPEERAALDALAVHDDEVRASG